MFDAVSLSVTNLLRAHKAPVSHIAINHDGTLVATASDKGTVIRVFGLPDGDKRYEFRRGSYSARIWSIGFNLKSTLMAVSSDTETVHVFRLGGGSGASLSRRAGSGGGHDWENGEDRYSSSSSQGGGLIGNGGGGGGGDLTSAGYDAIVAQKRKEHSS